jgi:hypothetical protein
MTGLFRRIFKANNSKTRSKNRFETVSIEEHNKALTEAYTKIDSLIKVNQALTEENTRLLQQVNSLQADRQEKVSIEEYNKLKKTNEEQKYKIIAIEYTNTQLQEALVQKGTRSTKLNQVSFIE